MAGRRPRVGRDEEAGQNPLRREPGWQNPNRSHESGAQSARDRGNQNALKHGMQSRRALNDRAQAIISAMLEDARCPDHLRSPAFAPELMAWGKAEAVESFAWDDMCRLMDEEGTAAAFRMRPGMMKSQVEVWKTVAAHAAQRRAALGISPVSYARIAKDLGIAAATTQDQLTRMAERGGEIARARLAVVKGDAGA